MVGKRYREANPWWGWLKLSRVQIADGIFSSLRFSRKIFICTWLSGILHEWECFSFFLFSEYLFIFSPLNGFYHAIQWGKITGLLKKAPCCEGMWGRLVLWFIISKISDFVHHDMVCYLIFLRPFVFLEYFICTWLELAFLKPSEIWLLQTLISGVGDQIKEPKKKKKVF